MPGNGGERRNRNDHRKRGTTDDRREPRRQSGGPSRQQSKPSSRPVRKGQSPGRGRQRSGGRNSYWIFGRHAANAALANPERSVLRILALEPERVSLPGPDSPNRQSALPDVEIVDRRAFDRIAGEEAVHQGIAILVQPLEETSVEEIAENSTENCCVVVLDRVSDPRNVGAVMRSAAAFGARALMLTDRHAPGESGALAKAAAGCLEHLPVLRPTNLKRALDILKQNGFWLIGLDGACDETIGEADLGGKIALVIGEEGHGLRRLTRESCDRLVAIPISNQVESLNLSVASSIALYEWRRRLRQSQNGNDS